MASQEELLLLRKTVDSVKSLEAVAVARDYAAFLNSARDLSEHVVKLVQMAIQHQQDGPAAELREAVKQTMGCAKILLRDKTDEALEQFRNYLKDVAKVIITITQAVKNRPAGASVSSPVAPVRFLAGDHPRGMPPRSLLLVFGITFFRPSIRFIFDG